MTIRAGFSREIITPDLGAPLVGYFNPRPNKGVFDELYVRVTLFESAGVISGMVNFDLCVLGQEMLDMLRQRLAAAGVTYGNNLIFTATHTHTGPYVSGFFGAPADRNYLEELTTMATRAVMRAEANLTPMELVAAKAHGNPWAFNRRYWMKNGRVLTNPGKLNPDIVKTEGAMDDEISVLGLCKDGRLCSIIVNIVNHTDTIGGDFVSADWPGRMERDIQQALGEDIQVTTVIGCSGNINHFDVKDSFPQTDYAEACRLGKEYAKLVLPLLKKLEPVPADSVTVRSTDFDFRTHTVSDADVAAARETLKRVGNATTTENMTSEGLATGDGPVARFFAEEMIRFAETTNGISRPVSLVQIRLGKDILFAGLPGEPFTEIGLAIKEASPCKFNFIASLSNSGGGYIAMPECYAQGGYEILPVTGGGPAHDTAPRLIEASLALLKA